MARIYRYEHSQTGLGPYQSDTPLAYKLLTAHCGFTDTFFTDDGEMRRIHPPLNPGPYGICGMTSLQSLREWFKEFEDDLYKEGFTIRKYNERITKRHRYNKNQVAFRRGN